MDQLQQTAVLLRQSCQPKFKLTDEQADLIRDMQFPDYKDGKVSFDKTPEIDNFYTFFLVLLGLFIGNVGSYEKR